MYCGYCGSSVEDGQKFCSNCGKKLYVSHQTSGINNVESHSENPDRGNEEYKTTGYYPAYSDDSNKTKMREHPVLVKLKRTSFFHMRNKGAMVMIICLILCALLALHTGKSYKDKRSSPSDKVLSTAEETITAETTIEETTTETTTEPILLFGFSVEADSLTNILFSKYDIDVYINDEKAGSVKNGKTFNYNTELPEGEYTLDFRKNGSSSVRTEVKIPVHGEVSYKCTLSRSSDKIEIIDEEIIGALSGIKETVIDVVGLTSDEAKTELSQLGFSRIVINDSDGKTLKASKTYIVVSQNIKPETEIDTFEELVLTCKERNKYISDKLNGLTAKEIPDKAKELGVEYTWLNYLTNNEMSSRIEKMDDAQLKKWKAKKVEYDESIENFVKIYLVYTGESKVPDVKGMVLSSAIKKLKEKDFSNISYTSNDGRSIIEPSNWIVIDQSVKSGTKYKATEQIVLTCKKDISGTTTTTAKSSEATKVNEENKTNTAKKSTTKTQKPPVSYHSSKDLDTARKGNSGVYAYREWHPDHCDNYIIIDFNNDRVIAFSDDGEYSSYTVYKIEEGSLDRRVIMSVTDKRGNKTLYGLHFKYVLNPEHLILQSIDGTEVDYIATDLSNALDLFNRLFDL